MNLRIKLTIEFDDDEETKVNRTIWLMDIESIDPTHAIVKALIEKAEP